MWRDRKILAEYYQRCLVKNFEILLIFKSNEQRFKSERKTKTSSVINNKVISDDLDINTKFTI